MRYPLLTRFMLLLAALLPLAVYSVHGSMQSTTLELPGQAHVDSRLFWPQGWSFFTRDPQGPQLLIYRDVGGVWAEDHIGQNADARNLFGLRRAPRARMLEAGYLSFFAAGRFSDCEVEPGACLAEVEPVRVDNLTERPFLCGEIGLVKQVPLPWAWLEGKDETVMPSSVARLEVSCS